MSVDNPIRLSAHKFRRLPSTIETLFLFGIRVLLAFRKANAKNQPLRGKKGNFAPHGALH